MFHWSEENIHQRTLPPQKSPHPPDEFDGVLRVALEPLNDEGHFSACFPEPGGAFSEDFPRRFSSAVFRMPALAVTLLPHDFFSWNFFLNWTSIFCSSQRRQQSRTKRPGGSCISSVS